MYFLSKKKYISPYTMADGVKYEKMDVTHSKMSFEEAGCSEILVADLTCGET